MSVSAGPALTGPRRLALVVSVKEADGVPVASLPRDSFIVSAVAVAGSKQSGLCSVGVDSIQEPTDGVYVLVLERNLRVRDSTFACVVDIVVASGAPRAGRALARVDS